MKTKVLVSAVSLLIAAGLGNCVTATVLADEAGKDDTKRPRYVQNEIIVKYRKKAADKLETGLLAGKKIGRVRLSDSLDRLGRKYKVKHAKSVFPRFKQNQRRFENLKNKDKGHLTKKEKHILKRLARAPKDAKVPDLSRIYKIELDPGHSAEEAVAAYNQDPDIEYAQLNYILSLDNIPNDPLYPSDWAMLKIQAAEAWDIHTGSSDVVVAVIDTGADYLHGDLRNNMWVNEAERYGTAGVDDDGNGYVDDIYGYNFAYNSGDPMDDHYHGTFCAGIIGAEGNNGLDLAGVCWNVSIMALKAFDAEGDNTVADIVEAVYYAVANGADITSNSYGDPYIALIAEAFAYACSQGVIMVAAAGNDDTSVPGYPAALPGVIAVAATDGIDKKVFFSNYGSWVDIAAPGIGIHSLKFGGGTRYGMGTSFAGPHVAGACALLLSAYPTLTPDQIRNILMETVDPVYPPSTCQSGRLNVFKAMKALPLSQGFVRLDREYYLCSDEMSISLVDFDLEGGGSHTVTVTANGGDSETVTLLETGPVPGIFEGPVSTASGDPNIEDGILQVSHDVNITATYEDSNDGTGNPATATDTAATDCQGPVIFNVRIDAVGPSPAVTFRTDEPTTAQVRCGLACGGPYTIEANTPDLATQHAIELIGVAPQSDYFFIIEAIDRVGNTSVDANAGACYPFTTDQGPRDVYVPGQYSTIQDAIDVSWDGGTVWVADGNYMGQGNRDIDFIGKAVMVRSENGPNNCIIDCNGSGSENHRGFHFHTGEDPCSVLDGFTITNGWAQQGGGIRCEHCNPTIANCIFEDNWSVSGAGLHNSGSDPLLIGCTFNDNSADYEGGGMYTEDGSPQVSGCIFVMNASDGSGGGIYAEHGGLVLSDCTFSSNSASNGGGIAAGDNTLTLTDCAFNNNSAGTRGGAIRNSGPNASLVNCIFSQNYSGEDGGAVRNEESICTFSNCTFSENSAAVDGGGMFNIDSNTVLTDCNFVANSAGEEGGGMWNERSSLDINDCNFTENSADPCGGAIWNRECTLTLTDCAVVGNLANVCGGGLWDSNSTLVLTDCNIIGNSAGHEGGGIYNTFSDSAMSNCVIAENTNDGICCRNGDLRITDSSIASNRGTGIELLSEYICDAVIVNCRIARNAAEGIYSVGNWTTVNNCLVVGSGSDGIFLSSPATSRTANCTIVANAGDGIELYERSRGLVDNCIICDNLGQQIRRGGGLLTTFSNVQGGWSGDGNIDCDPCFVDPCTGDYHLKSESGRWHPGSQSWVLDDVTSACIDKGDWDSPVGDEPYPNGGRINMGAYGGTIEASKSLTCWHASACAGQAFGDATCDGSVNFADLFALKASFGLSSGQAGYNCCADFTHDDTVDAGDLFALKAGFGTSGYVPSTGTQGCPQ